MIGTGSIGRRLTMLLAGVAALLSLLSWGMVTTLARQAAERTQDNVLAASVTIIAETVRSETGEVRLELPYAAFSMLGAISEDRVFYHIAADGAFLTGYPDLPAPAQLPNAPGVVLFETAQYADEPIRMATVYRRILTGGAPVQVRVSVAQTRAGISEITRELSLLAAGLSVAFFALAVILSAIVVRASMRPLTGFAQAVSRRGPSDLRPLRRDPPSELAPLLQALNRLMERLGQSIRRSEEFIAEAAHRVRTPLATVRTQAEIALRSASGDVEKQHLRRIIRAVDESSRSTGQLLDHATVAFRADDLMRSDLDLAALAGRTVSALSATAEMRDIDIVLDTEPAIVSGDAVLLENALHNVLDNAIKYSPEETTIRLSVRPDGGMARITVQDQGPGLGDDAPLTLIARFKRGINTAGVVGSGLGLTIADDVMRAHGGSLHLENGTGGKGTCVSLVLPLA